MPPLQKVRYTLPGCCRASEHRQARAARSVARTATTTADRNRRLMARLCALADMPHVETAAGVCDGCSPMDAPARSIRLFVYGSSSRLSDGPHDSGRGRPARVRAPFPPKMSRIHPPIWCINVFSRFFYVFEMYLRRIVDVIFEAFRRLVSLCIGQVSVRYRSGIGFHAWSLHVLCIRYMRLYRRFSILNDTY